MCLDGDTSRRRRGWGRVVIVIKRACKLHAVIGRIIIVDEVGRRRGRGRGLMLRGRRHRGC